MRYSLLFILSLIQLFIFSPLAFADEISEGYYRIVSAGNGTGYYSGDTPPDINRNYEGKVAWYNDEGLVRWADYDANDYSMIYKLIKDGDNWLIFNLRDQSYVDKGTKSYGGNVSTSKTPVAQKILPSGVDDKWIVMNAEARFIYSMTSSHNGLDAEYADLSVWGTPEECAKFGVNVWYFSPVSEEVVEYLKDNDVQGVISFGRDSEAPVEGKTYIIRNATEEFYITSAGGMTNMPQPDRDFFWQVEASGNTVDGYDTYYLKSLGSNGYWQHVDYLAKTWDSGDPYDAYDWYGYAGINAEFGDKTTAMELTILPAGSTSTWRTQNATAGYVLAMKDVIHGSKKDYFYKLGHQDNNVGMEPWNEGVGWLFYPVNNSDDVYTELQSIIDTYGNIDTQSLTISDDPGYCSAAAVEAYSTALANAVAAQPGAPRNKLRQLANALKTAAEALQQANPIREGYYYIVTAGNGCGYYSGDTPPDVNYNFEHQAAMYNDGELVSWRAFDPNDFEQIYHFFPADDGTWYVQSALNGTFINKGLKSYGTTVETSMQKDYSQTFELVSPGKFTVKPTGKPYVYAMAATHNGSTAEEGHLNIWGSYSEACKFGVNVWYIQTVSDEVMQEFAKTDAGLTALCNEYSIAADNMPTDDMPGYYYADKVQALRDVIATARAMAGTELTDEEKAALRQQLSDAYNAAQEIRPLTDGYYYIVNNYQAYNTAFQAYPAIYTTTLDYGNDRTACYYETFSPDNANFIFKVTKTAGDDTFTIQNAYTLRYLNTGNGTGNAGEVLTATLSPINNQIAKWHSVGKYWISDQAAPSYGHAIANPAALSKRTLVVSATTYDQTIAADLIGYNTWSLLPLSESRAGEIIAAQTDKDLAVTAAYSSLVAYLEETDSQYQTIIDDEGDTYNTEAVMMLKTKRSIANSYISARPYDITTTATEYQTVEAELRQALSDALTIKPDTVGNKQLTGIPMGATSVDYDTNQPSTTANLPGDAFDNDYTTCYAAYERSTGWVGLDLGKKYIIQKIAYAPRASWAKRMVLGMFEGANKPDFSDAIPFYMIRQEPQYNTLTTDTVTCSRGFRYVRYVGPNESRCNISELRFYGKPGAGDDSQLFQLTNLPLVVMRTEANIAEITSKSTWLPGIVNIISDEGTALKTDSMTVRGRGNGSWSFSKKPYKLKLANKSHLLDMPAKAREWTLINNYGDKTLIRNNVAFKLSEIFEMDYTPACTLVDVIFNGQYKGSYQLCDQVEVNKDRVNITKMTTDDNEGEAVTGGYLIEMDAYSGSEPKHFSSSQYNIPVTVHYPKPDEITDQQFDYIVSAFNDMCKRVFSPNFKSETEGYATVLAEDTWLKYFLLEELSGNTDGYWSVYMTKDRNDKFRVSPGWDFDLAFDNDQRTHPILTMTGYLSFSSKSSAATGVRSFNRRIVESCPEQLKEIWSWYRYNGNLNPDYMHAVIDSLGAENYQSQELNYIRWDILNTRTQQQYTTRGSYQAEVDYIFEYLGDRIAWMDNMVGLEEPVGIHGIKTDDAPHGGIHGHDGYLLVRGFSDGTVVRIYTPGGTLVTTATIQGFDNRYDLPSGIYIVRVTDTRGRSTTQKVAVN